MLGRPGHRVHHNQARTVLLLVAMVLVVLFVASRFGPVTFWLGVVGAAALSVLAYVHGDVFAVRAMRAYPVSEAEQPELCRMVRELTTRARIPMPRVYVSPTPASSALAAGRDPNHALVCVTEGALEILDESELRGVLAHEMTHIAARDTLPASVVGAVSRVAMTMPGLGMVVACAARTVLSRSREFEADRASARLTGEPLALASALRKLDAAARELVLPPERGVVAASHLMITSPLRNKGVWRALRSHPPTADRVARLEQLAGYRRW